ncbi:MAG TPA: homoserine kinase [Solirubrobacteraceae bacterium]|jgi:homoserine kinase
MTLARRRLIRVPASSANLGPGFDTMAAALGLHLELEVVETGKFAVRSELEVSPGRDNLVVRAFERLHPAAGFEFRISSQIPMSAGLGSSAAAAIAGLMAADHIFELDADIRAHAVELEGHPDNVAAALNGGVVVCDGPRAYRFEVPMGLEAVLVVPNETLSTQQARASLPPTVPLADAIFNVACGSLLAAGLTTGSWELISAGLRDRLHQPYRAHLYPRSAQLVERAVSLGALGATISGAGPAVMFWCQYDQTGAVVESLKRESEGWARVIRAPFEAQGADVKAL